jgi:mannose-1-phosphate guanylyltransferase
MTLTGVILVGGESTSSAFRPLSMGIPPSLLQISGESILSRHIHALSAVKGLTRVFLIGFYESRAFLPFCEDMRARYPGLDVQYLFESESMGSAGAMALFAPDIAAGKEISRIFFIFFFFFFLFNSFLKNFNTPINQSINQSTEGVTEVITMASDVIMNPFPLSDLVDFHRKHGKKATVLGARVPKETATRYGAVVQSQDDPSIVQHFVEKPHT